ncbi:leucyl/phenylalanyl-tRNA--protein transferase [Spartinivicinus poritis]|uniref:Leucyl/phenylalanyl-tRNA--protein transferase n=1 Tax=Spartinivicinus poritis TaxID=2994640 RepID=A0ABT5U6G8_9GAMM|nr:leucyl/phenylalanyl-tRNA--protein transferase [Spartinivicinus sp. A2-2]MDE1461581.1 leucyl/phenylalanyl-tRNA--protein transferase [Spartinivicinus sp. A2-2]
MAQIPWLNDYPVKFPPVSDALDYPDGLLAAGGNLSISTLLEAYRHGIFPWFSETEPILWWSPNPRMVLLPEELKVSRSLRKFIKRKPFTITCDQAFSQVMQACAEPRKESSGTWISDEMYTAYNELHLSGHAHSIECWQNDSLVGGLYGVAIGSVFFGESMFSRATNASKVALYYLVEQLKQWNFPLIDCQVYSEHLASLGARPISRELFVDYLNQYCCHTSVTNWKEFHTTLLGEST